MKWSGCIITMNLIASYKIRVWLLFRHNYKHAQHTQRQREMNFCRDRDWACCLFSMSDPISK